MVESGAADCVLAVGFEQMVPGALGMAFNDRKRTLDYHLSKQVEIQGWDDSVPMAAQQFGGAGVEYQRLHGTPDEVFGMISVKRSAEHTSELQSLMRISYAVFCL